MTLLNVLHNNIRKYLIEMLRYFPNTLSSIVTFYAIFLMFFLGIRFLGAPEDVDSSSQYLIANMVLWFLSIGAMQSIGWEIMTEANKGTLEQLYMSPVAPWKIFFARLLGSTLSSVLMIVVVLILCMLTAQQWLTFDIVTLLFVFIPTIISMVGIGFIMAALAIVFKQIQAFLQIVQFAFLALVSIPVTVSPWLELVPVMRGTTMLRQAMIEGRGWLEFPWWAWGLLLANAALSFALGLYVYTRAEERSMTRGLLGQY